MDTNSTLGRPVEPVPEEIADQVVAWIAEGKTLRAFCRQPGMPCRQTIDHWKDKDPAFASRIARARDSGYDEIAEECVEIIDTAEDANLGKARVWTRLQLLAKWNPKKYGERIQNEHSGTIKSILVPERIATERSQTDLTPDFGESSQ